jgi:hypothetical protein
LNLGDRHDCIVGGSFTEFIVPAYPGHGLWQGAFVAAFRRKVEKIVCGVSLTSQRAFMSRLPP